MRRGILATLVVAVMLTGQVAQLFAPSASTAEAATTITDYDLAAYWAPVWYQDADSSKYEADYITNFDFDGSGDAPASWRKAALAK